MRLGSKFHLKIPMTKSEKQRCIVQLRWVLVKLFHLRRILYNQTKYIFWTIIHWFWQAKPSSIHSFDQTHKNLLFFLILKTQLKGFTTKSVTTRALRVLDTRLVLEFFCPTRTRLGPNTTRTEWLKIYVNGWMMTLMDRKGWWWMKMVETVFKWIEHMKMGGHRWWWMKMDENGWKWMKMDENGWKWMKMGGYKNK